MDVTDLKNNTLIDLADGHPNEEIISHFWDVLQEFSQLDLSRLVQFVTGPCFFFFFFFLEINLLPNRMFPSPGRRLRLPPPPLPSGILL